MGKEAAIQSACLPVILGTDHHAGTRSPEHFLLVIILPVVAFHGLEDASPAERIAELVEETAAGSRILKHILVVFRQELRLAGCHLGMAVHELDERSEPVMSHLHIAVQENIILRLYLLQRTVVALGKAEVLLQHDGLDVGKLSLQEKH